jgi:hypothetical protein
MASAPGVAGTRALRVKPKRSPIGSLALGILLGLLLAFLLFVILLDAS